MLLAPPALRSGPGAVLPRERTGTTRAGLERATWTTARSEWSTAVAGAGRRRKTNAEFKDTSPKDMRERPRPRCARTWATGRLILSSGAHRRRQWKWSRPSTSTSRAPSRRAPPSRRGARAWPRWRRPPRAGRRAELLDLPPRLLAAPRRAPPHPRAASRRAALTSPAAGAASRQSAGRGACQRNEGHAPHARDPARDARLERSVSAARRCRPPCSRSWRSSASRRISPVRWTRKIPRQT